eukprot:TRINITY_DN5476_c0_g1_i2.p6 TRINITY_DN5476_c0_g1~~TRINITY_DN5476_c0_g1_i2.p6  ORF type:complete len:104 (+),score=51.04 TRINITY_DN5476_c0_g1_i2:1380-1691(+)
MLDSLMQNEEDRVKEREELRRIESEQRAATPSNFMAGRKEQCIKSLGPELYDKVYKYLKKAKETKKAFGIVQKEISGMVGNDKDKMNMVFFIDQIVDREVNAK